MNNNDDFQPNWTSAPGETITDLLEERKLPTAEFARRIGHTLFETKGLLEGREPITHELATKLQDVLGASATFWINRESQYRKDVLRLSSAKSSQSSGDWLSELPVNDMIKFGWITPASASAEAKETACLKFFDVPDVSTWRDAYHGALEMAAFRTSATYKSHLGAVATWLRRGAIEALSITCSPWDVARFKNALSKIRALTWKKNPDAFISRLKELCAECGVAVAIVRAPSGCRASGATRFLSADKALLQLSFRYLSDDHFWFTFFHEAGHLLLHGKNKLFVEGPNLIATQQEEEANDFAAEMLIPAEYRQDLLVLPRDGRDIIKFARAVGVAPGIVVGQLQHLGRLQRNQLNALKRRFQWADDN